MLYYLNDSIGVNKFMQQEGRSLGITGNRRGYDIAQIHIESVCANCGNVAYAMPYYSHAQGRFVWKANNDICTRCHDGLNDYHTTEDLLRQRDELLEMAKLATDIVADWSNRVFLALEEATAPIDPLWWNPESEEDEV